MARFQPTSLVYNNNSQVVKLTSYLGNSRSSRSCWRINLLVINQIEDHNNILFSFLTSSRILARQRRKKLHCCCFVRIIFQSQHINSISSVWSTQKSKQRNRLVSFAAIMFTIDYVLKLYCLFINKKKTLSIVPTATPRNTNNPKGEREHSTSFFPNLKKNNA